MSLTEYIKEELILEGAKEDILVILNSMDEEEISEFGEWLEDEILGDEEFYTEDDYTKEEVIEMLNVLSMEDLDYVLYMLGDDSEDELDEAVSKYMKSKNKKRGRRKFSKSKAELRKGKAARKKMYRQNKAKIKSYKRRNKNSIKKYAKSYSDAVKSGKHKAKVRV